MKVWVAQNTALGLAGARGGEWEQFLDPAHSQGTAKLAWKWLSSSLPRTRPRSPQHLAGPGLRPRDVNSTSRAGSELAPAHSAPRGSRGGRLPAVRHFRLTRRVGAPSLPAATGVDGGWWRAGSPALPSPPPSLPVPPLAAERRGESGRGVSVSAGA